MSERYSVNSSVELKKLEEEEPKERKAVWITYALASSIFFTLTNSLAVELSIKMGPFNFIYFASGSIFASLVFNVIDVYKTK